MDTNTLDHFQRGHPPVVSRTIAVGAANLAITVVTRIEMLQARFEFVKKAAAAAQLLVAQQRLDETERLLAAWRTVHFDSLAAGEFDRLRCLKGIRKVGRADLLIACIALANDAVVVTRNVRDFTVFPSLKIENWVD